MDNSITREEHNEFAKRIEEENNRQNHRIESLESSVREISALTSSVQKLAINMENMLKEQGNQGKRLEVLEGRDGEKWRTVTSYIITIIISIIIGYLFSSVGI